MKNQVRVMKGWATIALTLGTMFMSQYSTSGGADTIILYVVGLIALHCVGEYE